MRISLRSGIFLLLLGLGLFFLYRACRQTHYVNFPPKATGEWVAFGDSITAGYGAAEGNDYPALLGQRLGKKILNKGTAGNTTADAIGRVEEIATLQPRVVLLCLGGNDTLQKVPAEQVFDNLELMIDRLHAAGSFVVLIGIRSASAFDQYDKPFGRLARKKKVLYVPDILDGVLGNPSLMSDYIHPNEAGQKAIAERLEQILVPLIPKLDAPQAD